MLMALTTRRQDSRCVAGGGCRAGRKPLERRLQRDTQIRKLGEIPFFIQKTESFFIESM
jgi:hypothetical protein